MNSPVMTIGAMNSSARLGWSRRISATTRRTSARIRRALMPPPRTRRRTAGTRPRGRRCRPRARRSAPVPRASTRPDRTNSSSSHRSASSITWLETEDRGPGVGEVAEVTPELDPEQRVHAHRRLVEEQHRRPMDQRAGERQAPPLAARQRPRDRVAAVGKVHQRQRVVDGRPRPGAVDLGEEAHVLEDRERRVDAVALGHVADPLERRPRRHRRAQDLGPAAGRAGHAGEQADQRRLARPVGPEQAVDPAPARGRTSIPSTAVTAPNRLTRPSPRGSPVRLRPTSSWPSPASSRNSSSMNSTAACRAFGPESDLLTRTGPRSRARIGLRRGPMRAYHPGWRDVHPGLARLRPARAGLGLVLPVDQDRARPA